MTIIRIFGLSILFFMFLPFTFASFATSPKWMIVKSPNSGPGGTENSLLGVSAVSDSDVWAVGFAFFNNSYQTLAEHWNGDSWSIVPSPSPNGAYFEGVSAVSSSNVWAVGEKNTRGGSEQYHTLIEHYNGSDWSVVPAPNPPSNRGDFLNGVSAISANDAWAVGDYRNVTEVNGYPEQEIFLLVLHWNGASWKQFTSGLPTRGDFFSITSFSASDIWALSDDAWHFNGTAWSQTPPFPEVDGFSPDVSGLGGISGNDLWAVGSYTPLEGESQMLALHWNGTAWSSVATPISIDRSFHQLSAVAALNSRDVWAVGYGGSKNGEATDTLIEHWNGKSWSIVSSPNTPGTDDDELQGIAVSGPATLWAVGIAGAADVGAYSTLTLHFTNG